MAEAASKMPENAPVGTSRCLTGTAFRGGFEYGHDVFETCSQEAELPPPVDFVFTDKWLQIKNCKWLQSEYNLRIIFVKPH